MAALNAVASRVGVPYPIEAHARLRGAAAALAELDDVDAEGWAAPEVVEGIRQQIVLRKKRRAARAGKFADDGYEDRVATREERFWLRAYDAERTTLVSMRNAGEISNEVMHRIERELDLAESRLGPQAGAPSPNGAGTSAQPAPD